MDIVQQLRNRVEEVYGGNGTVLEYPDDTCVKAADEIERLRAIKDAGAGLLTALDDMHERGETFTGRVSLAVSRLRALIA